MYGTVSLIIAPTILADIPQPPINITLAIKEDIDEPTQFRDVVDLAPVWVYSKGQPASTIQNFSISLDPGEYKVIGLELSATSLSSEPFFVPFPGPLLTVPEEPECTYVGRINYSFIRLPPGTREQAQNVVKVMANRFNRPIGFVYLSKGPLVPLEFSIDLPKPHGVGDSAERSSYDFYKKAIDSNCRKELIRF